jgi:hypothetical protein
LKTEQSPKGSFRIEHRADKQTKHEIWLVSKSSGSRHLLFIPDENEADYDPEILVSPDERWLTATGIAFTPWIPQHLQYQRNMPEATGLRYFEDDQLEEMKNPLWFWIPWGIDAVIAVIALYFFVVGLADGTVSSFNMGLWMLILFCLTVIVGGSIWLRSIGKNGIAIALLLLLAIPGFLSGLLMLGLVLSRPDFK